MIGVQLSPCGKYRYTLERTWTMEKEVRRCMFLMLNPSTADATNDDRTISRCIDYGKRWGYGGLYVGNLYAFRSTDPDALWQCSDPVGADTDAWLRTMALLSEIVVCAWGSNAQPARAAAVSNLMRRRGHDLRYLTLLQDGTPGHPLYLKSDLVPQVWTPS